MEEKKIEKKIEKGVSDIPGKMEAPVRREGSREKLDILTSRLEQENEQNNIISEKIVETKFSSSGTLVQSSQQKRIKRVEDILEVDLVDIYKKLDPNQRKKFKKRGEEISQVINVLLDGAKIKTKKILSLIKEWLQMIPGVNKFFIEQLAKNKLDEIVQLKNK
jgi:hypothetical protein